MLKSGKVEVIPSPLVGEGQGEGSAWVEERKSLVV